MRENLPTERSEFVSMVRSLGVRGSGGVWETLMRTTLFLENAIEMVGFLVTIRSLEFISPQNRSLYA